MKSIYKALLYTSCSLLSLLLFSCESLEDTYHEFINEGETIYIGKADSIKTRGGRNRLELSWLLLSDPKVNSYSVYWNNGADSVSGNVVKTIDIDTVRLMFDNLNEGIYEFSIFLYDNDGNSSIKSSIIGNVYGESYENGLLNRTFETATRKGEDMIIEWVVAEEEVVELEIEYLNSSDELVKKKIPRDIVVDTLFNFPVKGSFTYRTAFRPEPMALDIFYADPFEVVLPN